MMASPQSNRKNQTDIGAAHMKKDAGVRDGGKRSAERAHIHVALEGISASQDTEMPHRRITSSDRAAALQLEPTGWRMPNGSAWPSH
jgi:hypothetical protein